MRGTIFKNGLEYNLEVNGESWRQGDKISGLLRVKNMGSAAAKIDKLQVTLAEGKFKKVKAQDSSAWDIIESRELGENVSLAPQEIKEESWEFVLSDDAVITDKTGSPYLLYAQEGNLQINVDVKQIFDEFLSIFENFLRFKVAQKKSKKGYVEVKLNPPNSKEMASIEGLNCSFRLNDKDLEVKYSFKLTVLESVAGNVLAQKKKREIIQTLSPKQYLMFGDAPNQDGIIKAINDTLAEVKSKLL